MTKDTSTTSGSFRKLVISFVLIYVLALALTLIIGQRTVVLSGEYPFSFDYFGHVAAILKDFRSNPATLFSLTTCTDCPSFYTYSRWFSLFYYTLLGTGRYLGLHPFVFYIGIGLLGEVTALYLLIKSLNLRFSPSAFLAGAIIFALSPYKIRIISSGTMYHLHHAAFTLVLAGWFFCLRDLTAGHVRIKHLLLFALSTALFFNVSINYLPILIYTLLILSLVSIRTLFSKFGLTLIWAAFSAAVIAMVNFPMLVSLVITGNTHVYASFNALSLKDSLTALMFGLSLVQTPIYTLSVYVLFGILLLLFLFSRQPLKHKFILISIYFIAAWLLHGSGWLFSHLPLMDSLRSLHRFLYFQFLVLFFVVYFGVQSLGRRLVPVVFLTIIIPILIFFYINIRLMGPPGPFPHAGTLPEDYFAAAKYLTALPGSKIYLPHYGIYLNGSMTGNYTWLNVKVPQNSESTHTNPFTSLFSIPGLIFTEGYQLDTPQEGQLRYLLNFNHSPEAFASALSYLGINHVIIDDNYFWANNFPSFPLTKLKSLLKLDKQFGHLSIYSITDTSSNCLPAYGDYLLGYCFNSASPRYLINKSPLDYVLDRLSITSPHLLIPFAPTKEVPSTLVGPPLRQVVIDSGITLPIPIFQKEKNQPNLFVKRLDPGHYDLLFPLLCMAPVSDIFTFMDEQVSVSLDGNPIREFSPYSVYQGLVWEHVPIDLSTSSTLSISLKGQGFVVFGQPLLLPSQDYRQILDSLPSFQLISTYGNPRPHPVISVNDQSLQASDIYNSTFITDLLKGQQISFTTNPHSLNYTISSDAHFSLLQLNLTRAYWEVGPFLSIAIINSRGSVLYSYDLPHAVNNPVVIRFPDSLLPNLPLTFTIRLTPHGTNITLYKLSLQGLFKD